MAEQSNLPKPVFQTADVPAGLTVTPASEIPKTKTTKKHTFTDSKTASHLELRRVWNFPNPGLPVRIVLLILPH